MPSEVLKHQVGFTPLLQILLLEMPVPLVPHEDPTHHFKLYEKKHRGRKASFHNIFSRTAAKDLCLGACQLHHVVDTRLSTNPGDLVPPAAHDALLEAPGHLKGFLHEPGSVQDGTRVLCYGHEADEVQGVSKQTRNHFGRSMESGFALMSWTCGRIASAKRRAS